MYWADKIAGEIIASGKYTPYWVDDMKTPSGRVHIGSLRGVVIHDLVYKALLDAGKKAEFTYVFDDHDPMDGLPFYLEKKEWEKHMGKPLLNVPSPDGKAKSYAEYYALEFDGVYRSIGCAPRVFWTSDLYKQGKMNDDIKICLDKAGVIKKIYEDTYNKKLSSDWYPFQVVCPKCGKVSTTKVTGWDGKEVDFVCEVDAVDWTRGCGHKGRVSPFSGKGKYAGKLSWKVEWAVKWKVMGVTVEGAGKDHMSAGGSHDIAKQVCKKVIDYPVPFAVAYEFFLFGGKKMSSSKGLGNSAKEVSEMIPSYLLRFLFARTDYREAIEFNPVGNMYIPDLFDEYDRAWKAYTDGKDPDLSRAFEMSQIGEPLPKKEVFLPRFRDVVNYMQQPNIDIGEKFKELKKGALTQQEKDILDERVKYAGNWLEKYAPGEVKTSFLQKVSPKVKSFSDDQKKYLLGVVGLIEKEDDPETLQASLYSLAKETGIGAKEAFFCLYMSLTGKAFGPKAGWLLLSFPKGKVIARLKEAAK